MEGHPRHHHRLPARLAALGQGDVEQPRGFLCVLPEHLVKVTHAVKEQRVRVRGFQAKVLLHHRRMVLEGVGHAVRMERRKKNRAKRGAAARGVDCSRARRRLLFHKSLTICSVLLLPFDILWLATHHAAPLRDTRSSNFAEVPERS